MWNAVPGFKSELKETRYPPDSQKRLGISKESRGAPVESAYKSKYSLNITYLQRLPISKHSKEFSTVKTYLLLQVEA